MSEIAPYFQRQALKCAKCGHHWDDWMAQHVRFTVWIAVANAITSRGCPDCGAKGNAVLMVAQPAEDITQT